MPEEYMGDVIGDVNSRRGRIEGMDDLGGGKIVHAYVPLAEMFGYSTFMIGSSNTGAAFAIASLKHIDPAMWNAISDESTSW